MAMVGLVLGVGFSSLSLAKMPDSSSIGPLAKNDLNGGPIIKEKDVVEISQSLKNVIEENQRLSDMNQKLLGEIQQVKDQTSSEQMSFEEVKRDRDELASTIERVRSSNRQYSSEIKKLEQDIQELQLAKNEYHEKASQLEEKLSWEGEGAKSDQVMILASVTEDEVKDREQKTVDLLTKVDAFTEQDEKLRLDAARAHYNMGNIYYEKGEYEIAAREYYQAVTLMPDDADSHFNLAFVSGENLRDYKTALKHYQMYLYLRPNADDYNMVKEKIVQSQLELRNQIDSPINKDGE